MRNLAGLDGVLVDRRHFTPLLRHGLRVLAAEELLAELPKAPR